MAQQNANATVTVTIKHGLSVQVPWTEGMNAQDALELAYNTMGSSAKFTYALQYFGKDLGNLVCMMNETYDTFQASYKPFYYWEFLLNGEPATQGIDQTHLRPGDEISFELMDYEQATYKGTLLHAKHARHALKAAS